MRGEIYQYQKLGAGQQCRRKVR